MSGPYSRASARERISRGKLSRGPKEHHATGPPSTNASTACASPFLTSLHSARRLGSPLAASHSLPWLGTRHDMHQQPPQAPFSPKSFTIAGQSADAIGRISGTTADGALSDTARATSSFFRADGTATRPGDSEPADGSYLHSLLLGLAAA